MTKNNQHRYFKIGPTSENPSEKALWIAIDANPTAKKTGNKGDMILSRQDFLAKQPAAQAERKTFMRYAKPIGAEAAFGHSPQLEQIVAPTTTRPVTALPVFKATPMPTATQQIDLWLTEQRNDILYNFRDKRFDKQFYADNALNPAPLNWAEKTENYIQQLSVSFKQKTTDFKNNVSAVGSNFLQSLKKPAYVGLAALPMLVSVISYGHENNSAAPINKKETTEVRYKSINTANDALKDFDSYKDFVLGCTIPENFTLTDKNIETLYNIIHNESPGFNELPTTGGKYDSKKYPKKRRGNGGGASGAYQFMASTLTRLGVVKEVGRVKFKRNEAHLKAQAYNKKSQAENGEFMLLPTVGRNGANTGTCYKVKLTEETKAQLGSHCPMDLYTTYKGAEAQTSAALKLYGLTQAEIVKKCSSQMGKDVKVKTKKGSFITAFTPQTLMPLSWYNGVDTAIKKFKQFGVVNVAQYAKMHLFYDSNPTAIQTPPVDLAMKIDSNALYLPRPKAVAPVLQPH